MNSNIIKLNTVPTFTGRRNQEQNFESFKNFTEKTNFRKYLPKLIASEENYLSEGAFGITFTIPKNDNFILKVYKNINLNLLNQGRLSLEKVPDDIPEINVGQPIARFGHYISVLIKQEGQEYGIPLHASVLTNRETTNLYISNLKKVAAIPQEGYRQFTEEVKLVRKHGYYLDIWNSNNFLLTDKNINIVDIGKIQGIGNKFKSRISHAALLRALADEHTLRELLPTLNKEDSAQIGKQLGIISNKLTIAMKQSKLPTLIVFNKIIAYLRDLINPLKYERIESIINRLIKFSK